MDSILCLDTSGSMAGSSLKQLQEAVISFLDINEKLHCRCAIVEFGGRTGVRVPLTENYIQLRSVVKNLVANGGTPMAEGLIHSLKELAEHGRVLSIGPVQLMPRLILMTDGEWPYYFFYPNFIQGQPDKEEEVLQVAAAFGQMGFPIACVGVSGCNVNLMTKIAALTGGMFTYANRIDDLTIFFLKQIYLTMYIVEFAESLEQLYSREVLRTYMRQKFGVEMNDKELDLFIVYLNSLVKRPKKKEGCCTII